MINQTLGDTRSSQNCHLFSLSELLCIFHREVQVKRRERVFSWIGKDKRLGGEGGLVWIDGARSMINRPNQYSSCWHSEVWLHRWKWVGRSRVWWWLMSAGQMFHFGERLFDKRVWKSPPGQWVRTSNIDSSELVWHGFRRYNSGPSGGGTTRIKEWFQRMVRDDCSVTTDLQERNLMNLAHQIWSHKKTRLVVLLIKTGCPVAGQIKQMQAVKRADK